MPKLAIEYCNVSNSLEIIKAAFVKPDSLPFNHSEEVDEPEPALIDSLVKKETVCEIRQPDASKLRLRGNTSTSKRESSKGTK